MTSSDHLESRSRPLLRLCFTALGLLLALPLMGGFLVVIQVVGGVNGLRGVTDLELSPDGAQLYAVGADDDALVVFARDSLTGRLAEQQLLQDGVNGVFGLLGPSGVHAAADMRHVYAIGEIDDTLVVLRRDESSGELYFVASEVQEDGVGGVYGLEGPSAVTVTPDGGHVLVSARTDDALVVFARDATTDDVSFVEAEQASGLGPWLDGAAAVAVSPDSRHVYVAAEIDDAISLFERDPVTGLLDFIPAGGASGLDGASAVAVSPDGLHVYATARYDDSVSVFARDSATGALSLNAVYEDGVDGVDGLEGASAVTVDPSGTRVVVAGSDENAVAIFRRSLISGELVLLDVMRDGDDVIGMAGAASVAMAFEHAYVAGRDANAIVAFDVAACLGDEATGDLDGDAVCDDLDSCFGDDLSGDSDGDGICDDLDVCPGFDDLADLDGDNIADGCDNCAGDANLDQADSDGDGSGDACDNCVGEPNSDQSNSDGDSRGDACDNCPAVDNEDQADSDGDSRGDACDNCPAEPNPDQMNSDGDSLGNVCDNCPTVDNEDQADVDLDGIGDACDTPTGVGDRVWLDIDGDGIQDGSEPGVPGVEVLLFDLPEPPIREAGILVGTRVTDANGYFSFLESPGTYYLEVRRPASLFTVADAGANDAIDSDIDAGNQGTLAISLDPGEWDGTWDAGLLPGVGDRVWLDLDRDGVQDVGEPGLQGVTVRLLNDVLSEVASAVTDDDGAFAFVGLVSGSYAVAVDTPQGYSFSPRDVGVDDTIDSDIDGASGRTPLVSYGAGSLDTTVDVGMFLTPQFADGFESGDVSAWSSSSP